MQPSNLTEVQEVHALLWSRFQLINTKQRLPHALLLIGPQPLGIIDFSYKMSAAILCSQEQRPCGECKSCRLILSKEHPDICCLEPDKSGGIIKIDQIRDLHSLVFRSPQLGGKRIIIINPAEKMNVSAANALLKLLEEPPSCVIFLLIAEQISTLPATIVSRCQQWRFPSADILNADYLTMAEGYSSDSDKGIFFEKLSSVIQDLTELMNNKLSVCALAEKWSPYDLNHLIWLIYLINSQMIEYKINGRHYEKSWTEQLYLLSRHFQPIYLFSQLDKINDLSRKLQQNISVNQTLALESLLLGYKVTSQ